MKQLWNSLNPRAQGYLIIVFYVICLVAITTDWYR